MRYGSQFTDEERKAVFNMYGGRCAYCGELLPDRWHVDHRWPKALDGSDAKDNLMPACLPCNSFKSDNEPEKFRTLVAWRSAWRRFTSDTGIAGPVPKFLTQSQMIVLQYLLGKHLVDIVSDDPEHRFYFETVDEQSKVG